MTLKTKRIEGKADGEIFVQNIFFDKLSIERIGQIYSICKQVDFNDLAYYFKSTDITPVNFWF